MPKGGLGVRLSPGDLEAVQKVLEAFTTRTLLPHLELRVRSLNQQVGLRLGGRFASKPQLIDRGCPAWH